MDYLISTDPARLDVAAIHGYLSQESYWARHIPLATVERAIAHSLCFGAYAPDGALAGFCRVVTDRATFAWLCDVFVLPAHRGHGLGKQLVRTMLAHPDLQNLRRHLLATLDAHCLYEQHGYTPLRYPERWLELAHPNPYPAPDAS
ncbi:GNAT family N-acetyltransferase [Hymenobacter ginsengisoli]|uniref:GNAT family N-acetyltransferase n=1 Tax=Hymenobacter ginsengisoli TaxID=1051626 RepID=A0ABP8QIX2_9BACT|nr:MULTISPECIES: GNAT family N-acetyltransferase [unclassified Hymenobacter]MBO2029768.1 GNAT family N-acetyltransferase [Hymenobacter sp. BT559]